MTKLYLEFLFRVPLCPQMKKGYRFQTQKTLKVCREKMSSLTEIIIMICFTLVMLGALNSGVNASFDIDPIGAIFGCDIEAWIYVLIGIAALAILSDCAFSWSGCNEKKQIEAQVDRRQDGRRRGMKSSPIRDE